MIVTGFVCIESGSNQDQDILLAFLTCLSSVTCITHVKYTSRNLDNFGDFMI